MCVGFVSVHLRFVLEGNESRRRCDDGNGVKLFSQKLNKLKTASESFLSSLVPKFSPKPHLGIFHLMNKYLFFNHHVMDTNET